MIKLIMIVFCLLIPCILYSHPIICTGEILYWDKAIGAESYRLTWYKEDDPDNKTIVDDIHDISYQLEGLSDNTLYIIEIVSKDCCGNESDPAIIKYYRSVGLNDDCCPSVMIRNNQEDCFVFVKGSPFLRPGKLVRDYCK